MGTEACAQGPAYGDEEGYRLCHNPLDVHAVAADEPVSLLAAAAGLVQLVGVAP